MFDVITIGAATRDVFVKSAALDIQESESEPHLLEACFPMGAKIDIDELTFETGGGATNAASTLSKLKFDTATVCAVGLDSNGRDILDALEADGISTELVQQLGDKHTAYSVIIVAGSGERTILVHRGASRELNADRIDWNMLRSRWFYITSLGGNLDLASKVLTHASDNEIKVAWNPGNGELKMGLDKMSDLIKRVDVFNVNLEEAATLAGESTDSIDAIMKKLRVLPRRLLVVTDGSRGAYASEHGGETMHVSALDVRRVNTTGAGDAFGAGIVSGLMKNDDVKYALAVGIWNAAGCIQIVGAKQGLLEQFPNDDEISQVTIAPWK